MRRQKKKRHFRERIYLEENVQRKRGQLGKGRNNQKGRSTTEEIGPRHKKRLTKKLIKGVRSFEKRRGVTVQKNVLVEQSVGGRNKALYSRGQVRSSRQGEKKGKKKSGPGKLGPKWVLSPAEKERGG